MFELTPFVRRNSISPFFRDFDEDFFKLPQVRDFKTDIKDMGNEIRLEADLPGVKKENIKIDIENKFLTISAERKEEKEEKDEKGNFLRRERSYGSFSRSFDISGIKTEDITAKYEDGVLTLTLPKKDKELPEKRTLEIQ
ncbi:MAG: Hsp20/alpha crystallin family protein [Clostridia bacterium]|nr:Hsp20/alpha crystallin family protein [Clostridia bacterium]